VWHPVGLGLAIGVAIAIECFSSSPGESKAHIIYIYVDKKGINYIFVEISGFRPSAASAITAFPARS
jgi:hypothetical protein